MPGEGKPLRAVLFDAGNTLLFLDYGRLAEWVSAEHGLAVSEAGLAAGAPAAAREMEARTSDQERAIAFLEALFLAAGVPAHRLAEVRGSVERLHAKQHLWCGIAADAHHALGRLRAAGFRLGVVSNSDGRVEHALDVAGLRQYFDVIVDSAIAGVEKPDPAIFRTALQALGVEPEEALYVGDLYEVDVVGAQAAGLRAVLLCPSGPRSDVAVPSVPSLGALAENLLEGEIRA